MEKADILEMTVNFLTTQVIDGGRQSSPTLRYVMEPVAPCQDYSQIYHQEYDVGVQRTCQLSEKTNNSADVKARLVDHLEKSRDEKPAKSELQPVSREAINRGDRIQATGSDLIPKDQEIEKEKNERCSLWRPW